MKKTEDEITDQLIGICPIPPLIEAIQLISQFAFSVESEPLEDIEEEGQEQINKEEYLQRTYTIEKQNNQVMASSTSELLNIPEELIVKQNIEMVIKIVRIFKKYKD